MASADSDDPAAFAADWLQQQQRFWNAFRGDAGTQDWHAAERQWDAACERWHAAMADSAPPAMQPALDAALQHTRLCLRLALQVGERLSHGAGEAPIDAHAWLLSPEELICTAATAMGRAMPAQDPGDPRQVRAFATANALIARIARDTLTTVRDRLAHGPPPSPPELLDLYCDALETHYLAAAGGDEFARVAGELVNTWVDAHAAAAHDDTPPGERPR